MTAAERKDMAEEFRLLRIELAKNTSATLQLNASFVTVARDVHVMREKLDVIEAKLPFLQLKLVT